MAEELKQAATTPQKSNPTDDMYFLEEDFAGRMTRVKGSNLKKWHKEQAELKEKFDRGEIPDPTIPDEETQRLIQELFGTWRTPAEAEKARQERLSKQKNEPQNNPQSD